MKLRKMMDVSSHREEMIAAIEIQADNVEMCIVRKEYIAAREKSIAKLKKYQASGAEKHLKFSALGAELP